MASILALTLFGSFTWFVISMVVFLVICFASEVNENGYVAFFSLLLFSGIYYLWGDLSIALASFSWTLLAGYLILGLIHSILRTFFKGRLLGRQIKDLPNKEDATEGGKKYYSGSTKESVIADFKEELKEHVMRWWLMWPVSLIVWAFSDLLVDLWDFTYKHMKNFFNYILEIGIKTT